VSAAAGFHPNQAGRQLRKELHHLGTLQLLAQANLAARIDSVDLPSTHPIRGPELRALRKLRADYPETPYVFVTERKGPMTPATARKLIARAGELAKLPFPVHPHMLRHACGFKLASEGQDTRAIQQYLGHKNITHTVRYTELSPERFKNFWRD
jgi:type 1 fimbriae regulatory protein FimB/type 1 fimbriae regulatory protein FimE